MSARLSACPAGDGVTDRLRSTGFPPLLDPGGLYWTPGNSTLLYVGNTKTNWYLEALAENLGRALESP